MKHILLFTFLFLMFLPGATDTDATLPAEERIGVESVFRVDMPEEEGEAYVDTASLTGQWRTVGRGQRPFSVQQVLLGKGSAYQAAKKRLEILFHSIHRVYTSMPFQSWTVSSDHYVFGMRRILI